jgi:hypothetical protein
MENTRTLAFFILALIVSIFILNTLANANAWYYNYLRFDDGMHFLGGVFIGLATLYVYYASSYITPQHASFISRLIIALGGVALIGIFWEFFEYTLYAYVSPDTATAKLYLTQGLPDTLGDLFADLSGGVFATILFSTLWHKKT